MLLKRNKWIHCWPQQCQQTLHPVHVQLVKYFFDPFVCLFFGSGEIGLRLLRLRELGVLRYGCLARPNQRGLLDIFCSGMMKKQ